MTNHSFFFPLDFPCGKTIPTGVPGGWKSSFCDTCCAHSRLDAAQRGLSHSHLTLSSVLPCRAPFLGAGMGQLQALCCVPQRCLVWAVTGVGGCRSEQGQVFDTHGSNTVVKISLWRGNWQHCGRAEVSSHGSMVLRCRTLPAPACPHPCRHPPHPAWGDPALAVLCYVTQGWGLPHLGVSGDAGDGVWILLCPGWELQHKVLRHECEFCRVGDTSRLRLLPHG